MLYHPLDGIRLTLNHIEKSIFEQRTQRLQYELDRERSLAEYYKQLYLHEKNKYEQCRRLDRCPLL